MIIDVRSEVRFVGCSARDRGRIRPAHTLANSPGRTTEGSRIAVHRTGQDFAANDAAQPLKPRRLRASSLELRPGRHVRMTRLVLWQLHGTPRRACSTTTSGSGKFCLATTLLALSRSARTSSRAAPGRRGPRRRLAAALDGALCSSAPGRDRSAQTSGGTGCEAAATGDATEGLAAASPASRAAAGARAVERAAKLAAAGWNAATHARVATRAEAVDRRETRERNRRRRAGRRVARVRRRGASRSRRGPQATSTPSRSSSRSTTTATGPSTPRAPSRATSATSASAARSTSRWP